MTGTDFVIRGRGSGSSNEGVSPSMIGMSGVKAEPEDLSYEDAVESEWVF